LRIDAEFARRLRSRTDKLKRRVLRVMVDIPELRHHFAPKHASLLRRILGVPPQLECSAGNWMMHIDADGRAYPCFAFEGQASVADESKTAASQWALVKSMRRSLGNEVACIGETAHAR
jgi:hypothetical protein